MPKSAKHLLIGSTEAYTGKSATVLGVAHQLTQQGLAIAYGKPLGTAWDGPMSAETDDDVQFIARTLGLPQHQVRPTVLTLSEQAIQRRLRQEDQTDYPLALAQYLQMCDVDMVLLEGPATLEQGCLFQLSTQQIADLLDAKVLLVIRFHSLSVVGTLLSAKQRLGDRLLGVVLSDVPTDHLDEARTLLKPFLEQEGIPVFGLMPRSALLRSVTVGELVHQLKAEVLCRPDRMDLMVESLTIGAMNVNSALKYFRKGHNMAVVTGGDRTDLQLAALETSTQCLILTGHMPPSATVLSRAEDLEIPILSVDLDTLSTVEIVDHAFGQVGIHEPVKVQYLYQMMAEHFNLSRLMADLNLEPAAVA